MPFARLLAVAAIALGLAFALPIRAADLRAEPHAPVATAETPESYLDRLALLLMIRATFDIVDAEALPHLVEAAAGTLDAAGADANRTALLDRELLAEGSYYLVSLRYLALSGGAIWPTDRPEHAYVNDALFRLDALQQALIDAVAHHDDPLPILQEAQEIMSLTYGDKVVPAERDRFAGRDELVDAALEANGPHANT